jgi:hypothetical protein
MSQRWSTQAWNTWDNTWDDSAWPTHQDWSWKPVIPSHWSPSSTHYDENVMHGYPMYRQIQPTAWSRKRGLHGMDPLQVPLAALCRYGTQEFSLRPFSAGRFIGVVTTRTVAESVFCAQMLKSMRDSNIDIDEVAEHLHRTQSPTKPVPSKQDSPVEFLCPVVADLVSRMKSLQPQKTEGTAVRRLQHVEHELREAQRKLAEMSSQGHTPSPVSEQNLSPAESKKREPSERLGATPKKRARQTKSTLPVEAVKTLQSLWKPKHDSKSSRPENPTGAAATVESSEDHIEEFSVECPEKSPDHGVIQAEECLRPQSPVLQDHVPGGHSDPTIKKWVESFPRETRDAAIKFTQSVRDADIPKPKLQEACIKYGLGIELTFKLAPRSMHQIIGIGAALFA